MLVALQQIRTSFTSIIMPEGLKSFLQEEPSLLEVGRRLEELVASCGVRLDEVVADTGLHTRCVMLGMDSPHLATVQLVAELRRKLVHVDGKVLLDFNPILTGAMPRISPAAPAARILL